MCCLADLLRLMPVTSEVTWTEYYNDKPVKNKTNIFTLDFLLNCPEYKDDLSKDLDYFTRINIHPVVDMCYIFVRYDTYGDD